MNILDGSHDYQQSIHNLPQYYYHRNVTPDGENRHYFLTVKIAIIVSPFLYPCPAT